MLINWQIEGGLLINFGSQPQDTNLLMDPLTASYFSDKLILIAGNSSQSDVAEKLMRLVLNTLSVKQIVYLRTLLIA